MSFAGQAIKIATMMSQCQFAHIVSANSVYIQCIYLQKFSVTSESFLQESILNRFPHLNLFVAFVKSLNVHSTFLKVAKMARFSSP